MQKCQTCEYEKVCEIPDFVRNNLKLCKTYKEKKVKTNADKIRSMSDEELAEFLPIVSNFLCRPTDECMNTICNRGECEKTKECALDWLKSPTTD